MYSTYPPFYPLTEENSAGIIVIVALISLIYAVIAITIKFFIRLNITSIKDFDIVLFVGSILYLLETACVLVACSRGLGQHRDAVSQGDFDSASKAVFASHILAIPAFGCAKLSISLLIRQLSNHGWLRRANLVLSALVVLWVLSGSLATVFQCPLPRSWNYEKCPATVPVYIFNGVMNILTDIALCVLPMAMMLEVQTTTQRKIVVTLLFGCRIITPAATIVSLVHFEPLSDSTWSSVSSTIWLQVSIGLSIITACIPSLKSVIDSYLGGTGRAMVQESYGLTRSGNENSLVAIRVAGDSVLGFATGEDKATERSVRTAVKNRGDRDRDEEENESVEGLTTAREENDREVASRSASNNHSRRSSVADYNMP